jgi:hypothetical protein
MAITGEGWLEASLGAWLEASAMGGDTSIFLGFDMRVLGTTNPDHPPKALRHFAAG